MATAAEILPNDTVANLVADKAGQRLAGWQAPD